jgi:hypothetical protein
MLDFRRGMGSVLNLITVCTQSLDIVVIIEGLHIVTKCSVISVPAHKI